MIEQQGSEIVDGEVVALVGRDQRLVDLNRLLPLPLAFVFAREQQAERRVGGIRGYAAFVNPNALVGVLGIE